MNKISAILGTYTSQEDSDKTLIKNVNGVKIAIISYTYGTNGIPVPNGKDYCINLIDKDKIKSNLDNIKNEDVDVIIACMHWGTEYDTTESQEQEDLANFLFKNGVDIIIGNHPHVLQSMHRYTINLDDGTQKNCFVAYSLGNFMADQTKTNTTSSIILNIQLTKHINEKGNKSITIDNIGYYPIYFYKNTSLNTNKFRILDINDYIKDYESANTKSISKNLYNTLVNAKNNIANIVGDDY